MPVATCNERASQLLHTDLERFVFRGASESAAVQPPRPSPSATRARLLHKLASTCCNDSAPCYRLSSLPSRLSFLPTFVSHISCGAGDRPREVELPGGDGGLPSVVKLQRPSQRGRCRPPCALAHCPPQSCCYHALHCFSGWCVSMDQGNARREANQGRGIRELDILEIVPTPKSPLPFPRRVGVCRRPPLNRGKEQTWGGGTPCVPMETGEREAKAANRRREKRKKRRKPGCNSSSSTATVSVVAGAAGAPADAARIAAGERAAAGAVGAAGAGSETPGKGKKRPRKGEAHHHPFPTEYGDHFETPLQAYRDIDGALGLLAKILGKKRKHLRIWDPYVSSPSRLRRMIVQRHQSVREADSSKS